jgi:hypothetical protein
MVFPYFTGIGRISSPLAHLQVPSQTPTPTTPEATSASGRPSPSPQEATVNTDQAFELAVSICIASTTPYPSPLAGTASPPISSTALAGILVGTLGLW